MLIQLNATVAVGGAMSGVVTDIIAPRVNSTAYNGLAIRNVGLCAIGGMVQSGDSLELAICNPRNFKNGAMTTAPNSVVHWKQYSQGMVDEAKWLEPDRYVMLESMPIYLEWAGTVARSVMVQILFEEVKLKDYQQIDMLKNNGWSI
jgi:hypothetical protein